MAKLTINGKTFTIDPHIGHCLTLQAAEIDLLGVAGDPAFEMLIADPVKFLTVLETLIAAEAGDDDEFAMPALAAHMKGGVWNECRKAVLDSFQAFFHENGYQQLAVGLERLQDVADMMTKKVAESLESGELRERMETLVDTTIAAATAEFDKTLEEMAPING